MIVFLIKRLILGLDLQGGSYLLLEIDNDPVIEQKLQNLTTTIRNYFKDKDIKINNIKIDKQNIFFNVLDQNKKILLIHLRMKIVILILIIQDLNHIN